MQKETEKASKTPELNQGQGGKMSNLRKQFQNYRLTTAEILYHMPDHPKLLQSYVWQEYDLIPHFPELKAFLDFWTREIEGKLHSVTFTSAGFITGGRWQPYKDEFTLH